MPDFTKCDSHDAEWNALTSPWLEVLSLDAKPDVCSPIEALGRSSAIRCIAIASPLDFFAAHRFLLTVLYWKSDAAGGVQPLRDYLLNGEVPRAILDAIEADASCFKVFDPNAPFLQDPSLQGAKRTDWKSAGSLFAEFAAGTNIAHFHHGDDENMRLCLPCATIGLARVIPWTQSGGAGLSPSIHNAPPIMALAYGPNLVTTLGLNLVAFVGKAGTPKWTGHFVPTDRDAMIPYLEAFTWSPRRLHLRIPGIHNVCWRCGKRGVVAVGPIAYSKNAETKSNKNGAKTNPFTWQDPSAFYTIKTPYTTLKSSDEELAVNGRDLRKMIDQADTPRSAVGTANPHHHGWHLVIPCTNPANNKTYDHRQLELASLSPDAVLPFLPVKEPPVTSKGIDGWKEPRQSASNQGAIRFVRTAVRHLTHGDWAILSAAAYREMHESPAAFDLLSGLLWPLRRKISGLPPRNVAWLMLKLMATVPANARFPNFGADFCPLRLLPKRQRDERRNDRSTLSRYPLALPRGNPLEAALRSVLDDNMRKRTPRRVDWAGLCDDLNQLLD